MKICFDANVVLDIFGRRDGCFESIVSYDVCLVCKHDAVTPISTFPSISYVFERKKYVRKKDVPRVMGSIMDMFDPIDFVSSDVLHAMVGEMDDFEDALISASALRNNCDLIVTRNKRDFKNSPVPPMTPKEFVDAFKPADYEYEAVEF